MTIVAKCGSYFPAFVHYGRPQGWQRGLLSLSLSQLCSEASTARHAPFQTTGSSASHTHNSSVHNFRSQGWKMMAGGGQVRIYGAVVVQSDPGFGEKACFAADWGGRIYPVITGLLIYRQEHIKWHLKTRFHRERRVQTTFYVNMTMKKTWNQPHFMRHWLNQAALPTSCLWTYKCQTENSKFSRNPDELLSAAQSQQRPFVESLN